jgi:hypothetical protein
MRKVAQSGKVNPTSETFIHSCIVTKVDVDQSDKVRCDSEMGHCRKRHDRGVLRIMCDKLINPDGCCPRPLMLGINAEHQFYVLQTECMPSGKV